MTEFTARGQIGLGQCKQFDFMSAPSYQDFYYLVPAIEPQDAENRRAAFVAESMRKLGFVDGALPSCIRSIEVSQAETHVPYTDPRTLQEDIRAYFVEQPGRSIFEDNYAAFKAAFAQWYAGNAASQDFSVGRGGAERFEVRRSPNPGGLELSFARNMRRFRNGAATILRFAARVGRASTDVVFAGEPELSFFFDPNQVDRQERILPEEMPGAFKYSFVPFTVPLNDLVATYCTIVGEPFKPLSAPSLVQRETCNTNLARLWGTEESVSVPAGESRELLLSSYRLVHFPEQSAAILPEGALGMSITESCMKSSPFPDGKDHWFAPYWPIITMTVPMKNDLTSLHEWGQRAEYFSRLPSEPLRLRGVYPAGSTSLLNGHGR